MMDFFWQFAFNMKMPMTVVWVLTLLLASIVIYDSRRAMAGLNEVGTKYGELEWRVWTSVNVAAILSVIWMGVMAVPAPDFRTEIVEKPVVVEKRVPVVRWRNTRTVYKIPTYEQAFKICSDNYGATDGEKHSVCHRQATEAAMPPYRVKNRTLIQRDPYRVLFEKCMDQIYSSEKPNAIPMCQAYALRKQILPVRPGAAE